MLWGGEACWHVIVSPFVLHGAPSIRAVDLVLALAGIALIAVPASTALLMAVAVLQLASILLEAPIVGNNWLIAGAVDVILLTVLGGQLLRRAPDRHELWRRAAPAIRPIAIVVYGFATLDKLNPGFTNPAVSCATRFMADSLRTVGLRSLATTRLAGSTGIWSTVVIEALIPVLLLWPRTRTNGVLVGLVFHGAVAVNRFHAFGDFSTVMFALLMAYLPETFAGSLPRRWRTARWVYAAAALVLVTDAARRTNPGSQLTAAGAWLWAAFALAVVVAVGRWWWVWRPEPLQDAFSGAPLILFLVPLVLLANGATPYIGVKNGVAFNMYSNLTVSSGHSNSVVFGHTLQLSHALSDPVTIIASSDAGLRADATDHWALTWDAFRYYASRHPRASVRYERAGRVVDVPRMGDDPSLRPPPAWRRKALTLRLIDLSASTRCQESYLLELGDG
jgi:hypothetical protein